LDKIAKRAEKYKWKITYKDDIGVYRGKYGFKVYTSYITEISES
jgi:hypothetical protein